MKSFVITILDNEKSIKAAERCISSGAKFGVQIEKFKAITPKDDPATLLKENKILEQGFREGYSYFESCASAFLSHFSLWQKCAADNQPYLILEHDAVFVDSLPKYLTFSGCVNIGKPSYGRYNKPNKVGVNPLFSKRYFPGAHAYIIKPRAAEEFVNQARLSARPTDVFIGVDRFNNLEELYPWPVEAKDSFTTIQRKAGCVSKHNYNKDFKIERV